MDEPGFTWLGHPETGGVQRFPDEALDAWRARGWVDADPPEPVDPTKDPVEPEADPEVDAAPDDVEESAPAARKKTKAASAAKSTKEG